MYVYIYMFEQQPSFKAYFVKTKTPFFKLFVMGFRMKFMFGLILSKDCVKFSPKLFSPSLVIFKLIVKMVSFVF